MTRATAARLLKAGASIFAPWLLLAATAAGASADATAVQPTPDQGALKLIVIELFFLIIGLLVVAVLGFLIWRSLRRKKGAKK